MEVIFTRIHAETRLKFTFSEEKNCSCSSFQSFERIFDVKGSTVRRNHIRRDMYWLYDSTLKVLQLWLMKRQAELTLATEAFWLNCDNWIQRIFVTRLRTAPKCIHRGFVIVQDNLLSHTIRWDCVGTKGHAALFRKTCLHPRIHYSHTIHWSAGDTRVQCV
jgi:hypothetical protein